MPEDNIFDDLPDEKDPPPEGGDAPKGDDDGGITPEEKQRELEEKQREEEKIRNLKIASKREDSRIAKLEQDLAAKREKAKKLKAQDPAVDPDDDKPTTPEATVPPDDLIKKTVTEVLREKEEVKTLQTIVQKIREVAKTRQEAEAIMEESKKFPSDWSAEDRVAFAKQRVQTLRERSRGFVAPSSSGAGGFEDLDTREHGEEIPGFSKERIATLKRMGWTLDELKKFKDGPDLGRVWGDGKILTNNR